MSLAPETTVDLGSRFAREFPELSTPWSAADFPDARLLVLNAPLAVELGLDPEALRAADGVAFLTGNRVPASAAPVAQAYAGHQFGGYSPVLGDGRALLLGELTARDGALRDLHLKGSGPTPFARGGDGLAAVGPMLREYVISEAMHALGVPTTRALAVSATGLGVQRETMLPGAVLTRVAASHVRVGTFQFAASTGEVDLVRRLVAHALERHYPERVGAENPSVALLEAVIDAQASLIAKWMLLGFVHGVMNTDNMTISGETIDYGPCAFMDAFDPASVFSSIDLQGRYAFGRQPLIAEWNLTRFAEALLPTLDDDEDRAIELAQNALGRFRDAYNAAWFGGMLAKLGIRADADDAVTTALLTDLVSLLQIGRVDYTGFFRRLGQAARGDEAPARALFADPGPFDIWGARWRALNPDADAMDAVNPAYIPRNHLVEEALAAATEGDVTLVERLVEVVGSPYVERTGAERYAEPAPEAFGPYRTFCGT
ncbi:YdiU family protein [Microbacterium sp. zg.Y1090]|uniref:protein adenylyltransferase SelO n=1 Tax=Microbacterium TaxID=33882 RepID=UPI00214B37BF|nr:MULTISPECIES: YdiU family protein [unclassified Microbacterium]MCR2812568.1 YdiU family protein [Microbacterium sp. zg.Y1084]MCR2817631.1 YdiU family protein [Microbacterium sp. zg.Y1090]MDL5485726.1 YdiU family protein [Microbacterium sp. zg-Y1211]WIM28893.1 YdiU family protein [Microbacterium sp. zg-Y1090]